MQWVNPLNNSIFLSVHCADLLLAMVQARFKLIKSQVKIKSKKEICQDYYVSL